ncbi:hypothetical protein [Pseudofrankia sp. DC12]|uniref:biotin synthase auxiliary protein BsaP n=1 Tax=Pseudofrankia sp. DC12 TaxID=683315 RepID=UPI0005F89850|nr:hypothetical protein [Pseudofrankia sp. DC12]
MTAEHHTPASTATPPATPAFCDRCGEPAGAGAHDDCATARALEPPRYCPICRRRLVVQVVPTGWTARCAEHGISTSPR